MPARRGRRAARRSWVPSRQRSAAAGSPHLARSRGEDRPLSASDEAQEGGGGGEGVKVKSSEAAAGPWAAASAGCFDHGGAVAVSFCSPGSSRAAGRPPWGPALPRPPAPPPPRRQHPGGRTRGSARPPAGPSRRPLLSAPAAPRAAASCWGGGRRPAPAAALPRRGAWGAGPGARASWEPRQRPRLCSPQPTPPGPPTRAHSPHACTLLAGGDAALRRAGGCAKRRARTTAAGSRARRRRHARAHAGHTRAHRIHTYARPPNTQLQHTCAHTHARTQARRARIPTLYQLPSPAQQVALEPGHLCSHPISFLGPMRGWKQEPSRQGPAPRHALVFALSGQPDAPQA